MSHEGPTRKRQIRRVVAAFGEVLRVPITARIASGKDGYRE
jgi:hypothetical protein